MIGFKDGKFHIEMKAGLVTGLGAKGFVNVAASAEEMLKILGYCFKNVNHHYLDNVQPDAFDNYVAYGFWLAVKYVPELRESFEVFTGASAFTNWLETTGSKIFGNNAYEKGFSCWNLCSKTTRHCINVHRKPWVRFCGPL